MEIAEDMKQFLDENKVIDLPSWKNRLRKNENDQIKSSSILNIELILENDSNLKNMIGYNEFSGYVHLLEDSKVFNRTAGTWQDSFETGILSYIEQAYNVVFDSKKFHSAVTNVSRRNMFNPVKKRIEKEEWDKVARVETFFIDLLGIDDNPYTREVTKRWLVGSIARVYNPGVKFEIVPIINGYQGAGKSTAVNRLYTDEYFTDSLHGLGENKDDYLQLQGNVIIELAELSSMKRTDVDKMKNFISAKVDVVRLPYERNNSRIPRKCVFIGTSNNSEYLKDSTGERRFYPLPVNKQAEVKEKAWDKEDSYFLQVLAEAKVLYDTGTPIFFHPDQDKELIELAKEYQENAKTDDPIKDSIASYLSMEVPLDWDNANSFYKRIYYLNYPSSKNDLELLKNFKNGDQLKKLDSVLTTDILEVVFKKDEKDLLDSRINSDMKKINLIIDNMDGWQKKQLSNRNKRRGFFHSINKKMNERNGL